MTEETKRSWRAWLDRQRRPGHRLGSIIDRDPEQPVRDHPCGGQDGDR